jgi:hypothetical protein
MRMCTYRDEWHAGGLHASRKRVVLVYFAQMSDCTLSKLKPPWQTRLCLRQPSSLPDWSCTATHHGNAWRRRIFDTGFKCKILRLLSSVCTLRMKCISPICLQILRVEVSPLVLPCRRHEHARVIFRCVRMTAKSDSYLRHVYLSVLPSAWSNSAPIGRIFMEFDFFFFFENLWR